jgi:hypothetical protein
MYLNCNSVTHIITIKKGPREFTKNVYENSPKQCPRKITPKEEFYWTKMSTRIHEKCPRKFTYFVHENSPFMSTRILPPLDIPMQSYIQHIFSQIINSYFYFHQRFSDLFCKSCTWKQNWNVLSLNIAFNSFWSEVYKKMSKIIVLLPSATFATFIAQLLWLWSMIGSRVKISHYI